MPKAYSFSRFSTPGIRARRTAGAPVSAAAAYCARNKLELDSTLTAPKIIGRAARNATESALADFSSRTETGAIPKGSYLLVERLEVTTRHDATDVTRLLKKIVEQGVTVVALNDGLECTRATLKRDPTALLYAVLGFMRAHSESAGRHVLLVDPRGVPRRSSF